MERCNEPVEQSRILWEQLADDWDERMGDTDNQYHREIIRPATLKLLNLHSGEYILDAACGNGNFSRFMAKLGVRVTAFDYSAKLIEHAKKRCKEYAHLIDFHVVDATRYADLMQLQSNIPFDKAVSNMAIMDISDISSLMKAVYEMLKPGVFSSFQAFIHAFKHPICASFRKSMTIAVRLLYEWEYKPMNTLSQKRMRSQHLHETISVYYIFIVHSV